MLNTILIIVAVVVVSFLGYAATKPDEFRVERTTSINAPPEKIFPYINDYRKWMAWSPYEKKDPKLKRTYSGPDSGVGSSYAWDGNKEIGSGNMKIVESIPSSLIRIDMQFITPMENKSVATFTLKPEGETTTVTWTMLGPNPFIGKVMGIIFNLDKMVGNDFAAGLADLKTAAEQ